MEKYIKTWADRVFVEKKGGYFDPSEPEKVRKFFEKYLCFRNGPKELQPFILSETQWNDLILPLYGWRKKDGRRRFSRVVLTSGKKGFGKSAICAGLALYHLLADDVHGGLCVLGACVEKQAFELFKEVKFNVERNEDLSEAVHLRESVGEAYYKSKDCTLQTVSWEAAGKAGVNTNFVCLDEVAQMHDSRLFEMYKGSMKAAKQPLLMLLSNAGSDKGHFYFQEIYKPAKEILENKSDDTTILPIIYECAEDLKDWKDKEHLKTANPHLGNIIDIDAFDTEYNDAMKSKAGEIWYRRYALNSWVLRKNGWLDVDVWNGLKGTFPDLSKHSFYAGCDLSATTDLTSVVAVYPVNGKYYVKCYNFVTQKAMDDRDKRNDSQYLKFKAADCLNIEPGNAINYEKVRATIKTIPGKCEALVFDRGYSTETSQILMKEGFPCLNFPQTHLYYSEPVKKLEILIAERNIVHDGDLCLAWAINNVELDVKDKLAKPVRPSFSQKIDPVVGLLMGLSQAITHGAKQITQKSVYDQRGVFTI